MDASDLPILVGGCSLIIGTWVAYGTQTFRVLYTRSGEGVSPWQPTLNYIGSYFLTIGVLILKGRDWFGPVVGMVSLSSLVQTVPFFQIAVSLPLSIALLASLLWALKTAETLLCFAVCVLNTLVGIALWTSVSFFFSEWLEVYGQMCCMFASIMTMITWLPQIILVFTKRSTGELSLVFLLFEFIGSATTILYQALPWFGNEPWNAWLPEFVLFSQQFILVCLWTWFNRCLLIIPITHCMKLRKFATQRKKDSEEQAESTYEMVEYPPPYIDGSL